MDRGDITTNENQSAKALFLHVDRTLVFFFSIAEGLVYRLNLFLSLIRFNLKTTLLQ